LKNFEKGAKKNAPVFAVSATRLPKRRKAMRKIFMILTLLCCAVLAAPLAHSAGGTLKIALTSNLNTLDPAKTKSGDEYLYMFMVFNALTMIDRDLTVKPDLAEKWESSADLKTWTFHLRKGVKFHHGRELDSEDVKATIERIQDKATGSTARVNFLMVDKIETPDKSTVKFTLNIPYSAFPEICGERQARIVPKDKIGELATHPVGTGPFMFKSFKPGDRVELTKNPAYFESGVPKLEGVVLLVMPESATRIAALETGETHAVWKLPLEAIDKLKKNPGVIVDEVPTSSWDGLVMHNKTPPFDDPRVRKAVLLAIDKAQMAEIALFGHGSPTITPIPPSHPFFNQNVSMKSDIAAAKKLLAEAGHPNGFEVALIVPEGRPERERLGVAAREMLKAVGIKVNIQRVPWDKFLADVEGKAAFSVNGFFSRPTVDTSLYPWFHSAGSWNTGLWHYKNERVDKILDTARQAASAEERKKLYQELQQVVSEDPPSVVPYVVNQVDGFRKEVKGLRSNPMLWFDVRNVTIE
jgi:peptide/nickel transport system substrate-binding protein